jgi:hypothetical protein
MSKILLGFVMLMTGSAFATVDGHDRVFLVVRDINSQEYFVERVPVIGCYGLVKGPHLVQFTSEYRVNSNIGCGAQVFQDNINYLSCAKFTATKPTNDGLSFSEITLDISKCDDKDNPKLITVIRTAAKLNFPQKKGEVKLVITK